jgi:hypothetical protein
MKGALSERVDCDRHRRGDGEVCGVAMFMERTTKVLTDLTEFKEVATTKLDRIEHLEKAIEKVATHTQNMDTTLKGLADSAHDLLGAATSKKHVPISIFYLVVLFLGAWMIIDKLASNRADVQISPTSFSYQSKEHLRDNSRPIPYGPPSDVRGGAGGQ